MERRGRADVSEFQGPLSGLRFFFECEEVREEDNAPERRSSAGIWIPKQNSDFHTKIVDHEDVDEQPGPHNHFAYFFDGSRTNPIPKTQIQTLLSNKSIIRYKAATIYHQASHFWGVDYDITDTEVENDDDSDSPDEPMDWSLVRFARPTNLDHRPIGVSYVDVIGEHENLYASRQGQRWNTLLFPDPYQADIRDRNARNREPPYGSLNGNLCVLIALLAFSASPSGASVNDTLITCINSVGWTDPIGHRGLGCMLFSMIICLRN